jgi:cation diffusion facilitator family transporter
MKNLRAIRRVLYITMAFNLVAMAAKLLVGYLTGALSLIAGGFDSLFDAAGNVIGLVGIYLAARPADRDHPYGHHKFETMAAITISLLLFLTTWELLQSAWAQLRDLASIDPAINAWSFVSMAVSLVVQFGTAAYELRAGRRLKSDVLVADARHTRADLYVSLSVIAGLIAVRLGYPVVDPLLAIGIAIFIFKIGIDIIRESSQVLLDGAIIPVSEIERIVLGVRDVRACHDVRSRGHEAAVYVDLHIKVVPEMSTAQSHAIAHDVQHRLRSEMPAIQDVVVHVEPEDEGPAGGAGAETALVLPALRALAQELDLAIHDIAARWVEGAVYVEAHLTLDGDLPLAEAHERASQLERESRARIPHLAELVTHIEPSGLAREPSVSRLSREEISRAVQEALDQLPGCGPYHRVRVYSEGEDWAVSLHCLLEPALPLRQAHEASSLIENQLRNQVPRLRRVTVHVEPLPDPAGPASGSTLSRSGGSK